MGTVGLDVLQTACMASLGPRKCYHSNTKFMIAEHIKKAESATKFQGKLGRLEGVGVECAGDVQ